MTGACSNDLEERATAAMQSAESCRAVAARFGPAPSSVVKWTQRARCTGSVAPAKMGADRRAILEPHREWLPDRVRCCAHVTLSKLQDLPAERGVVVSLDTVSRFPRRCGFGSRKDTLVADARGRPGVKRRRERRRHSGRINPTRLVFIDETWVKTNMAPLRGWAPKGERLPGAALFGHRNATTFIAALRQDRAVAPRGLRQPR